MDHALSVGNRFLSLVCAALLAAAAWGQLLPPPPALPKAEMKCEIGPPVVQKVRLSNAYRNKNTEEHEKQLIIPAEKDPYAGDGRTFTDGAVTPVARAEKAKEPGSVEATVEQTFDWGKVTFSYSAGSGRHYYHLQVGLENTGAQTVEMVTMQLATFTLPDAGKPVIVSSEPDWALSKANIGEPLIWKVPYADGQMIVSSPNPGGPLRYMLAPGKAKDTVVLTVTLGEANGGKEVYDGKWDCRPIAPGKSDQFNLIIDFGPADPKPVQADPLDPDLKETVAYIPTKVDPMAAYALTASRPAAQQFAKEHPFLLQWHDRRPIGAVHVADNRTTPGNPRGWKHAVSLPAEYDVAADAAKGYPAFKEAMGKAADRIIKQAQTLGLQGVIVWQVEGEEHRNVVYYGEPRLLPYAAPEMDAAADDFFKRLRDAGLRPGVCIRPQLFSPTDENGARVKWPEMKKLKGRNWVDVTAPGDAFDEKFGTIFEVREAQSALERLDAKISYAKKRWGCTLFYIDTNHLWRPRDRSKEGGAWDSKLLPAEVFEELYRRHPGVLLVPEHEYLQYWSATAPYRQPPGYGDFTSAEVRNIYPGAFSVISVSPEDADVQKRLDYWLTGITSGDIVMVPGWYGGSGALKLYSEVAQRAPWRVLVKADGSLVLQPKEGEATPCADAKALTTALAPKLKDAPMPARNVWVQYEAASTPAQRTAAIDAVGAAQGLVIWSSLMKE